ncbi:MAG: type I-E CRISPR-associated protein Cas6/Cse3/CasE [Chloroflexi bacterium]|nr:type I-E CRISPR-associated protein Cas6/Cse3/CasE [Chloroflexota bacterium]
MTTAPISENNEDAASSARTLYLARAEIDGLELRRWMGSRRLIDDDHAMHCLLSECFGDIAPKPFRLMLPRDGRKGTLYGYSRADADELRDAASLFACPLQERVLPLASLDSKPMPSEWQTGRRLGFEVRARPIVRLQRDIDRVPEGKLRLFRQGRRNGEIEIKPRRGVECDAFQYEALMHRNGEMKRSRETVYRDWLQKRFENKGGATLGMDSVNMVSFRRTRAIRKLHRRYSEGPDALMRGELEITDCEKFGELLANGIGRHKAYGYGMLLLRPASRARA